MIKFFHIDCTENIVVGGEGIMGTYLNPGNAGFERMIKSNYVLVEILPEK